MKFTKLTILLNLLLISLDLLAEPLQSIKDLSYNTFGGLNYKQSYIKPKDQWGQLFVKTQPGFDVYLGWRFNPNFSVEAGYEWTANKPTSTVIAANSTFLGVTNTTGSAATLIGKVRFKTGHADLNAYIPFALGEWAPEWILSAGVGGVKPSMKIAASPNSTVTAPFTSQFTNIEGRSMAVLRAGVGIQANLIEDVGVRALVRYENTSVLEGRGTQVTDNKATEKIFHNGVSLAVGLFVKF